MCIGDHTHSKIADQKINKKLNYSLEYNIGLYLVIKYLYQRLFLTKLKKYLFHDMFCRIVTIYFD